MGIGERIKQARQMRGLSLRALAQQAGRSAQAISNYERGVDVPGSEALLQLARALDVRVEFFLRPHRVTDITPAFRKRSTLGRKRQTTLLASIRDWIEKYLEIESLRTLGQVGFKMPQGFPRHVKSLSDVETAAIDLRKVWQLGLDPIENMIDLLEDKGIKVGVVDADYKFDACTFKVQFDGMIPVIVTRRGLPGDRQRFNLAHELGHLLLSPLKSLDAEKVAHRFAGAFLAPEQTVRFELGEHRQTLEIYEIHLLKHKYGFSMQAWIYRAMDLGILPMSRAGALFKLFKSRGWHKEEPGDAYPPEQPTRFERLVMQALAEEMIGEKRAAELLGKPLKQFSSLVAKEHQGIPVAVHY
jgi:Zn-dependent peptidase ImmA (M78 family)/DNA-binding XRE family transcriptional regulator